MKNNKRSQLTKDKIKSWISRNGRLPKRNGASVEESKFAAIMENYLSKKSVQFDPDFRAYVLANFKRRENNKSEHDLDGGKKRLLSFIKAHKRVPSMFIPEEKKLCYFLRYLTQPSSVGFDKNIRKQIQEMDQTFGTSIPCKYRTQINKVLDKADISL
jgi:hypothetical protein